MVRGCRNIDIDSNMNIDNGDSKLELDYNDVMMEWLIDKQTKMNGKQMLKNPKSFSRYRNYPYS